MKAIIVSAEKQTIPQFNQDSQKDEPTLVVATTVQFQKDDGTAYLTQTFAQRPEDIDADNPQAYFDRQADILQRDLDASAANAPQQANSTLADEIVEKLITQPDGPQED